MEHPDTGFALARIREHGPRKPLDLRTGGAEHGERRALVPPQQSTLGQVWEAGVKPARSRHCKRRRTLRQHTGDSSLGSGS